MDLDFNGRRAIVCGATDGIGKATAFGLANLGCEIILIARNEEKLKSTALMLPSAVNQSHQYIVADFDHPESLEKGLKNTAIDQTDIHIVINNSGGPPGGLAIDAAIEEYRVAFNRHLICNQILTAAVVPAMKKLGYGRVINIISTSVKSPLPGLGVSNTIRGAVANWSKTLANELGGFGITVNNVLPGATATGRLSSIMNNKVTKTGKAKVDIENEMRSEIPAKRFASPEEIADAIIFLASASAGYINGINLPVDGGRLSCL